LDLGKSHIILDWIKEEKHNEREKRGKKLEGGKLTICASAGNT